MAPPASNPPSPNPATVPPTAAFVSNDEAPLVAACPSNGVELPATDGLYTGPPKLVSCTFGCLGLNDPLRLLFNLSYSSRKLILSP